MQQYMAGRDGMVCDWHVVHYGKLAVGGFGLIVTEALAIEPEGRLTYRDLGVWDDSHVSGLSRLAELMARSGSRSRRPVDPRRPQGQRCGALSRFRAAGRKG
jgi:2,4-dienoyl-CoA reductase-like NADH-dependent reductase (Old Yellow Enzyme family)